MNNYFILHPANGSMNHTDSTKGIIFFCVASMNALNINNAFVNAQNDFNAEYEKFGVRSTSVGDVIYCKESDTLYFVKGCGFEIIDNIAIANQKIQPLIQLHGDMANEFNDMQEEDYWNGDESDNFLQ